jgi:hypothetical protein
MAPARAPSASQRSANCKSPSALATCGGDGRGQLAMCDLCSLHSKPLKHGQRSLELDGGERFHGQCFCSGSASTAG